MFSVHTTPENFKGQLSPGFFLSMLRKTQSENSQRYSDAIVFENLCFQNIFIKAEFSNSSGFEAISKLIPFILVTPTYTNKKNKVLYLER